MLMGSNIPTANLCALLTEMTDAYTSFKLNLGRFQSLVW